MGSWRVIMLIIFHCTLFYKSKLLSVDDKRVGAGNEKIDSYLQFLSFMQNWVINIPKLNK